jgi:hypothetical protein
MKKSLILSALALFFRWPEEWGFALDLARPLLEQWP